MTIYDDLKIGAFTNPISSEADKPVRSAAAMKTIFDANSTQIKTAFNAAIDRMGADKDEYDTWKAEMVDLLTPDQAANLAAAIIQLNEDKADKVLPFFNTVVDPTAFEADETYEGRPYAAEIPLEGVTAQMYIMVNFSDPDATSGVYSPDAHAYNGGVKIFATEIPESDLTIPTIICIVL